MNKQNELKAPLSVCWDVTNKCNSHCRFCYRFVDNIDIGPKEHNIILNKLILLGVKKISFSGGEPLLAPDLPDLLRKTKEAGVITSLISNGILLPKLWDEIKDYIDWLTLPMDGSDESQYFNLTRGGANEYNILTANIIRAMNHNINLKFNTVLCKKNVGDLENIALLVKKLGIKRWKIFHFIPIRGESLVNKDLFYISEDLFYERVSIAQELLKDSDCKITIADHNYLQNNYFWINADGAITVTENYKDIILGNALSDDLTAIWESEHFDHDKHHESRMWLK